MHPRGDASTLPCRLAALGSAGPCSLGRPCHATTTKRSADRTNSQLNQGSIVNYQYIAEAEPMAEMERTHSNEGSPSISKERNKVRIHDEFGTSNMLDMPKYRIIPGKPIGNTLNKPARLNEMKRIQ